MEYVAPQAYPRRCVVVKRRKRPQQRQRTPSTESDTVDRYLREVGFTPRMIADDFWDHLSGRYPEYAERFLQYVNHRRESDNKTDDYLTGVDHLYRVKNASLDFTTAVTSQYFGRLYASYLAMVETLSLPRAASSVLDVGCDNGILTSFYARYFSEAHVLGVDRCNEGLACAATLRDRLCIPNVFLLAADAFEDVPHPQIAERQWDIIFMTLCGYEQLERHLNTERALAARFLSLLKPRGIAVVVEYPSSALLPELHVIARLHEMWTLNYEAFGGDQEQVFVSVVET